MQFDCTYWLISCGLSRAFGQSVSRCVSDFAQTLSRCGPAKGKRCARATPRHARYTLVRYNWLQADLYSRKERDDPLCVCVVIRIICMMSSFFLSTHTIYETVLTILRLSCSKFVLTYRKYVAYCSDIYASSAIADCFSLILACIGSPFTHPACRISQQSVTQHNS
jgi:hypothetical protein